MNNLADVERKKQQSKKVKKLVNNNGLNKTQEYKMAVQFFEDLYAYNQSYEKISRKIKKIKYIPTEFEQKNPEITGFIVQSKAMMESIIEILCIINNVNTNDVLDDENKDPNNIVKLAQYKEKTRVLAEKNILPMGIENETKTVPNDKNKLAHNFEHHKLISLNKNTIEYNKSEKYDLKYIVDAFESVNKLVKSLCDAKIPDIVDLFIPSFYCKNKSDVKDLTDIELFTCILQNNHYHCSRNSLIEEVRNRGYESVDEKLDWVEKKHNLSTCRVDCVNVNIQGANNDYVDPDNIQITINIDYNKISSIGSQRYYEGDNILGYYTVIRTEDNKIKTLEQAETGDINIKRFSADVSRTIETEIISKSKTHRVFLVVVSENTGEVFYDTDDFSPFWSMF